MRRARCWGSGSRQTLTPHDSLRRETRCPDCGRILKVRPAFNGRFHEATLPQHAVVQQPWGPVRRSDSDPKGGAR